MGYAIRIQMTVIRQDTPLSIVKGMIIGTGDNVNTKPLNVLEKLWFRSHEGPAD